MFEQTLSDHRKFRPAIIALTLLSIIVIVACGSSGSRNSQQNGEETQQSPVDVGISLSEDEAKAKVISFIRSNRDGIITVPNAYYQEYESVKVPCSQLDVDTDPNQGDDFLARCKPVGGAPGAPYGYKEEQRPVRRCCKHVQIPLPDRGTWIVQYVEAEDIWEVILETAIEEVVQQVKWVVQDNTGNVSETSE